MSTVNVKNDVVLNLESCEFSLEFNGKTFTAKSFDGVIKQKEEHQRMLEEREIDRSELVGVLNLINWEEFLYHPTRKHLYKENSHGFLDRCEYDSLGYGKDLYCEKSKLDVVDKLMSHRKKLIESKEDIEREIDDSMFNIKSSCIDIKNHKKKIRR
ncbi:hypothetical protein DRO61_08495 [Candidatus Bathyarchaeota archaeon]|nr:MAG: hypothetical protein DRO61_08495 [Candidatus Bathyarchaeota archaeon]